MIKNVVFDLGGVLLDHNPRYLYRSILDSEIEIDEFLNTVCTHEWNERQDAGRLLSQATEELINLFPHKSALINAYYQRWEEMLKGPIDGSVHILTELRARDKTTLLAFN